MRASGVYEILNVSNGKRYIGSARCIQRRWNEHRSQLERRLHCNPHLQSAWVKHGADRFVFRTLLICGVDNLLLYEQLLLTELKPEYNVLPTAGNSIGRVLSAETRAKIAAKHFGKKRSPESLAKFSETVRGRRLSPERAAKLIGNKHALGLRHTEEWKAANSARNLGIKRPKSPEQRAKMSAAMTGRKATPEQRAARSAFQLGKKRGPYKRPTPTLAATES